mmetsp:Transcript_19024/g.30282  ORF Transcript_19024/g.30282 Transcript_19024/m.30282 type:complete len:258 (+) Transcript_19024:479-1252(+)
MQRDSRVGFVEFTQTSLDHIMAQTQQNLAHTALCKQGGKFGQTLLVAIEIAFTHTFRNLEKGRECLVQLGMIDIEIAIKFRLEQITIRDVAHQELHHNQPPRGVEFKTIACRLRRPTQRLLHMIQTVGVLQLHAIDATAIIVVASKDGRFCALRKLCFFHKFMRQTVQIGGNIALQDEHNQLALGALILLQTRRLILAKQEITNRPQRRRGGGGGGGLFVAQSLRTQRIKLIQSQRQQVRRASILLLTKRNQRRQNG